MSIPRFRISYNIESSLGGKPMFEEILENLEQADVKDFTECLLENLRDPVPYRRYKMFLDFKHKEPGQWNSLSKGCKAAADIFMRLISYEELVK